MRAIIRFAIGVLNALHYRFANRTCFAELPVDCKLWPECCYIAWSWKLRVEPFAQNTDPVLKRFDGRVIKPIHLMVLQS